jgi:hypothetical protein
MGNRFWELFDLGPFVIDAARASPLGELHLPVNLRNQSAGEGSNLAKGHSTRARKKLCRIPLKCN